MNRRSRLLLNLDGTVSLTDGAGRDLTPSGGMGRALLALLGDAPRLRMTRSAIRSLLWPDRSEDQAAASLRRLIADLRGAAEAMRRSILSGTGWIGLDAAWIEVRAPPPEASNRFAADLEPHGPALAEWLARRRRLQAASMPADGLLTLILQETGTGGHPVCDMILQDAARRVSQYRSTLIRMEGDGRVAESAILLRSSAVPDGDGRMLLSVSAVRGDGRVLESRLEMLAGADVSRAVTLMSAALTKATMCDISGVLDGLMSFDRIRMRASLERLSDAPAAFRPGISDALAAFGTLASWLDRIEGEDAVDKARARAADALRTAPDQPVACAAAAIVFANSGDVPMGVALAERAVRMDPRNGFARYAATTAFNRAGNAEAAAEHAEAVALGALAGVTDETAAMGAAMAAARAGRERRALDWARRAWLLAPSSRPAMRFVSALAFRAGDEATAAAALRALETAEPGFSAAVMAEPDYPVATLRDMDFLDVAWARHLGGLSRNRAAKMRGGGR